MALLSVSGCESILLREYSETSQHQERQVEEFDSDYLEAEDNISLKDVILRLVESHQSSGIIRVYSYRSQLENDIDEVCDSIKQSEPLGNYAVQDISYDLSRLIAYSELSVTIKYKKSKAEIDAVENIFGRVAYEERLTRALREFETSISVRIDNYDNSFSTTQLISKTYYTKPNIGLGMPDISEKFYPSAGTKRIIVVTLKFPVSADEMVKRMNQVAEQADAMTTQAAGLKPPESALLLYDLICERVAVDYEAHQKLSQAGDAYIKGDESNVFGALINRKALSEGFALAYKLLCDNSKISCLIVTGSRDGLPYYWNMVYLDGAWYHVDAAADNEDEQINHNLFLADDKKIPATYEWGAGYPSCDSSKYSYEMIAGITEP